MNLDGVEAGRLGNRLDFLADVRPDGVRPGGVHDAVDPAGPVRFVDHSIDAREALGLVVHDDSTIGFEGSKLLSDVPLVALELVCFLFHRMFS